MPDDLDARLCELGVGPSAPLPPAASVRARGDQRSRRGRALLGGTAALLTALAVLAGTTLASTEPVREADVLDVAPPTRTPVEHPVRAALLDPEDVDPLLAGSWTVRPVRDVPFPALPDDCSGSPFTTSAPQQGDAGTAQRHLDGSQDQVLAHAVLSYSDADRARSALARLRQALASCPQGSGTVLTDVLEDPDRPRSTDDRLYGILFDDPDAASWVVERLGRVLSAVRVQPGSAVGDLPLLADAAAAEVDRSGLLLEPAGAPPSPVDPVPLLETAGPAAAPRDWLAADALLDPADAAAVEPGDWEPDPEPAPARLLDPCAGGTAYPRDAAVVERASGSLTVRREAGGTTVRQEAWRYRSAEDAAEALAEHRRAVLGCPEEPGGSPGLTTAHELVPSAQGTLLVRVTDVCQDCLPYPTYLAAVQDGDAVLVLLVAVGEDGDPGVPLVQRYLAAALAALERARA